MDLNSLASFQVLAKHQNVTQAAQELHVAQPALSRTLRNLEKEFGLPLFDRLARGIRLNQNGKILLEHVQIMLQEYGLAQSRLQAQKELSGQRVSISMQAASKLLPDILRGIQKRYPQILLQIMQQDPHNEEGARCDIVIEAATTPAQGPRTATLLCEELCLAVPVQHPLAQKSELELIEAAAEPFLALHKGISLRDIADEYCKLAGFTPRIVLESDNPGTLRELIAMGVGLALIPEITWRGMDTEGELRLLRVKKPYCIRYLNISWQETRYVAAAAVQVRNYLQEYFRALSRARGATAASEQA